jgi:energy-coupling factor transporter ATP-binding protein EcfA2
MRLVRLELKDIGPFEGALFEIPEPRGPGELVLFEGPNGSGKTTIVQTIAILVSGFCAHLDPSILAASPPLVEWRRRHRAAPFARATIAHEGASLDLTLGANGGDQSAGANLASNAIHVFQSAARAAEQPVAWAAFAHGPHQRDAELNTTGPREIEEAPLRGALSFGAQPASSLLGQLLTNLENERTKALAYASERADEARKLDLTRLAESRKDAIKRFEQVFSKILGRDTTIEFSVDRQAPAIFFERKPIPPDLLGEGLRSTIAWLSDLLVRLERVRWADPAKASIDQEFWLILDEIDESLHPTMQVRVLPALRELFPNAHIYATTHSPFVVASVGEGTVFPIRPDKDRMVRGKVEPRQLQPGQSLELVTTEIFGAPSGFVDQQTRDDLAAHDRDVQSLQRKKDIDWATFWARRDRLMDLNEEVRTVVAMQEVPVQQEVLRRLRERAEAREAHA